MSCYPNNGEFSAFVKWHRTVGFFRTVGAGLAVAWNRGETMETALRREIMEELGEELNITDIRPWAFRDDTRTKTYQDGTTEEIYMIYLIFDCISANRKITFNEEFQEITWVSPEKTKRHGLKRSDPDHLYAKKDLFNGYPLVYCVRGKLVQAIPRPKLAQPIPLLTVHWFTLLHYRSQNHCSRITFD
ncbi:Nucleoside triphosphatase nudI [Enterobacter cancerogenus]|uniref:Nucleoside triphosphatase nudI n=1 Tax=Enterobacter cancerogenus TaxID=69218 RepID=A0A484ZC03_9ENTR|nr:Nucleoside triphosphatase nudI [Enterobacter cancerogenus]